MSFNVKNPNQLAYDRDIGQLNVEIVRLKAQIATLQGRAMEDIKATVKSAAVVISSSISGYSLVPEPLSAAPSPGRSGDYARGDHSHLRPSPADIGALPVTAPAITGPVTIGGATRSIASFDNTLPMQVGSVGTSVVFNGATAFFSGSPVGQQTVAAVATDLATVITLANSLRQALINLGLSV